GELLGRGDRARGNSHTRNGARQVRSPVRAAEGGALSTIPRTMRRKWVSGRHCESNCAGRGIASQGNMKPDKSIFGNKKKKLICIACCCVCASVEKKSPSARLAAMKTKAIR